MRVSARTGRRLLFVAGIYLVGIAVLTVLVGATREGHDDTSIALIPTVILLAFVFETVDSSAGMGFGTSLAPLLFVLGFGALQVVPALLAAEAATGLLAGMLHHEFRNIQFSWRPPNEATRSLLLVGGLGTMGAVASAALAYFAVPLPEKVIKTYVAILVLLMGGFILVNAWLKPHKTYRPRRLVPFAVLAGVNKGLGGGGYGPVITLGAVFAGIIEKSATAMGLPGRYRTRFCRAAEYRGMNSQTGRASILNSELSLTSIKMASLERCLEFRLQADTTQLACVVGRLKAEL